MYCRQNGTRCRDGVKSLWCHSHQVWLGFEGCILYMHLLSFRKGFCDLFLLVFFLYHFLEMVRRHSSMLCTV